MPIVGCYSPHLYCENLDPKGFDDLHGFRAFPHEFCAERGSECRAKARKLGWKLNLKAGTAICPKCRRKK